jgi:outer membrane protein
VRGLGVELLRNEALRVRLGLRFDSGRRESADPALAGMGDVKRTIRARIGRHLALCARAGRWGHPWTVDAFGRGGGNLGEATAGARPRTGAAPR